MHTIESSSSVVFWKPDGGNQKPGRAGRCKATSFGRIAPCPHLPNVVVGAAASCSFDSWASLAGLQKGLSRASSSRRAGAR